MDGMGKDPIKQPVFHGKSALGMFVLYQLEVDASRAFGHGPLL